MENTKNKRVKLWVFGIILLAFAVNVLYSRFVNFYLLVWLVNKLYVEINVNDGGFFSFLSYVLTRLAVLVFFGIGIAGNVLFYRKFLKKHFPDAAFGFFWVCFLTVTAPLIEYIVFNVIRFLLNTHA